MRKSVGQRIPEKEIANFAFAERSAAMKAPVGLLSDRTVLRQQDGRASPRQVPVCRTRFQQGLGLHTPQQEHYQSPTNVRTLTPDSNEQRQGIIMAMVSCLLLFLTAYGILGLVQQIGIYI